MESSRRSIDPRGRYTVEGFVRAVCRACVAAGITPWTPYQVRNLAKLMATRECGLDAARAFLGQESLGTTNGYAAGIDLDLAARVVKKLAASVQVTRKKIPTGNSLGFCATRR
jgi:integrase